MIRVATSYFDVLYAMDSLNAAEAEVEAIGRQRDQAKKRFDVGLASITEVQDTQAAYDLSVVGKITREAQLDSAKESLSAIIGGDLPLLSPLKDNYPTPSPEPIDREEWVKIGLANNFQLKAAHLNTSAAKSNARASGSAHLPKIDIVGTGSESETNQFNYEGFEINGQGIPVPAVTGRRNYSIQLSMPLFQGGAVNSRRKQAYSQYSQADENTLFTERRIIQEVRSQFSNVNTLVANVTAQTQAVISATSALEATQVGYKVGTRNVVDLLQAEKNLYSAEKNLANAKYDYILANLRLALAAGTISPSDIVDINNLLK
mgnify:CR=1 FL=1